MFGKEGSEELFYHLALSFVPGIGSKTAKALIARFGSASAVFKMPVKDLRNAEGIGEVRVKAFKDATVMKRAEQEMTFIEKEQIKVLYSGCNYPTRLSNCSDAPLLLFYRGNAMLNATRIVAIVGTRSNTDYGHRLCDDLVDGLRSIPDLLVVSGLALGIDAIAHKKCLQANIPTVGVMGHGLDRVYPYTHKQLAEQMTANGGILAEFPSGTLPERNNFPMRNRVVAGMSDVTVVIESNIAGGALITAHMAAGYNREVAAYPGRVNDSRSAGCNELIRTNLAAMITRPEDLIDMMNWGDDVKPKAVQKQLFLNLSPDEQKIVDMLQTRDSVHADELLHHTGLKNSQLAATLLQLEMQGLIKTLPGKQYRMH